MFSSSSSSSTVSPRKNTTMKANDIHTHLRTSLAIADVLSWCCAIILIGLILVASVREDSQAENYSEGLSLKGNQLLDRPCDEIYVVGEGETLHTISNKCGDPFIVERNPHIHDPDDVFPGLVIKINPVNTKSRKLLR